MTVYWWVSAASVSASLFLHGFQCSCICMCMCVWIVKWLYSSLVLPSAVVRRLVYHVTWRDEAQCYLWWSLVMHVLLLRANSRQTNAMLLTSDCMQCLQRICDLRSTNSWIIFLSLFTAVCRLFIGPCVCGLHVCGLTGKGANVIFRL